MAADLIRFMHSMFLPIAHAIQGPTWQPAVDIYRTSKGWLLKFDLAGVRPEDIDVNVSGSRLSVHGRRRDWATEENCRCYRMEISYSHFERTIDLPEEIRSASIQAEYRDGMLLIRIQPED